MAEPLRKEDQLTTADLAGRRELDRPRSDEPVEDVNRPKDQMNRPKPVGSETLGGREPWGSSAFGVHRGGDAGAAPAPLFAETDVNELRARWSTVQAGFVDEPRRAVEDADKLVATAMERLAQGFANERSSLERQWSSGDQVSTEDLRVALQRYRSFFDRLLHA
jgi:hypothetical protein